MATVKQLPASVLPQLPVQALVGNVEADYLDAVAERAREAGIPDVSVHVLEGLDIAAALVEHRKEVDAQLTVMSTHGRGPARRAWMGSVADRFVRSTEAPVLLVRAVEVGEEGAEPDLSAEVRFVRVLVPLDGSQVSEAALEPAIGLGRPSDAAYVVVRLNETPHALGSWWFPAGAEATEEQLDSARRAAESELAGVSDRLRAQSLEVETVTSSVEHVAEGIIACAEDAGADLIAMATHGHGGVRRLALGSVTDKVLRAADCPILVVPPPVA